MNPETTRINQINQRFRIIGKVVKISKPFELKSYTEQPRYGWQVVLEYHSQKHTNLIALQVYEDPSDLQIGNMVQAVFAVEAQPSHKNPERHLNFVNGFSFQIIE